MTELERLRQEAHEAPFMEVMQDHKGRRFLKYHSRAWADTSRRYMEALRESKRFEE